MVGQNVFVFPGKVVSLVGFYNWAELWVGLHSLSWLAGISGYASQLDVSAGWTPVQVGLWACFAVGLQVVLYDWAGPRVVS